MEHCISDQSELSGRNGGQQRNLKGRNRMTRANFIFAHVRQDQRSLSLTRMRIRDAISSCSRLTREDASSVVKCASMRAEFLSGRLIPGDPHNSSSVARRHALNYLRKRDGLRDLLQSRARARMRAYRPARMKIRARAQCARKSAFLRAFVLSQRCEPDVPGLAEALRRRRRTMRLDSASNFNGSPLSLRLTVGNAEERGLQSAEINHQIASREICRSSDRSREKSRFETRTAFLSQQLWDVFLSRRSFQGDSTSREESRFE